jgi:hypothetical protein
LKPKAEFAKIKSPPPFNWNAKKRKKRGGGIKKLRRIGTHARLRRC